MEGQPYRKRLEMQGVKDGQRYSDCNLRNNQCRCRHPVDTGAYLIGPEIEERARWKHRIQEREHVLIRRRQWLGDN